MSTAAAVADRSRPARVVTADDGEIVAPRIPTEEQLAGLWAAALGVDEVGVTSDFFGLGGDTRCSPRSAVPGAGRVGREVSLYTLFTNPTVAGLAAVLDADPDATALAPLTPAPAGTSAVASSAQVRLWALDQLGDDVVRHHRAAVELRGDLDKTALRRAFDDVLAAARGAPDHLR